MGRTKGSLKAGPEGTPASTAPFPELASEIGGDLVGRNRPDEGLGAKKESMVSLYGPRRRKSPKVSSVGEWRRMGQEGGKVQPTPVHARRGRFAVCASV